MSLPADVTITNGKAQFLLVFTTTGTPTLTLTDDATSGGLTAGTATVTVVAAPTQPTPPLPPTPPAPPVPPAPPTPVAASQLALLLPPKVPSGVPVPVMAVAEDASNHPVPGYNGTATLSIANGSATLISVISVANGSATSSGTALPATVTIVNGQANSRWSSREPARPR